jgi:hypothetical protein
MINTVGTLIPTEIRITLPSALKLSGNSGQITPVQSSSPQVVLPPAQFSNFTFSDKISVPFLLSPSDFAATFSNNTEAEPTFTSLLASVTAAYTQSSLLNASRLSISA